MKKTIENFEVDYLQILDENGNLDSSDFEKLKLSVKDIKNMYRLMILGKTFDERAVNLQREGRLGTYASGRGEEACQVGSVLALRNKDWIFPSFRENIASIAKGMPMEMLLQYWGGDEGGSKIPKGVSVFTVSIPVGSHPLHAVGYAFAAKLKKEKIVTLPYFGDGATSTGDFYEAMNFAGVFKAPVIFFCQNNQWAISVPRNKQTAAKTLAQKAIACGFEGIQVDGNDIFAVYSATRHALEKALKGEGPTLIEAYTYRLENHTTSDDASRYRNKKELEEWKKKDPILRLSKFMIKNKMLDEKSDKKLLKDAELQVSKAVEKYMKMPTPNYEDIFNYTYEEMTEELKDELNEIKEIIKNG